MSELPENWTILALAEVGRWFGGGTPSKTVARYWDGGTIPWVSPKDMKSQLLGDAQDHITEEAVRNSATNLVESGSVMVVARSGILKHTLPIAISTQPVAINQDLKAVKPSECISAEYLALALKNYEQEILHSCTKTGTTVHNIELPTFLKFRIPVAPLDLQQRIVAKIEELFSTLDKSVEYLRTTQDQLKIYRQSLLKHAFEGKLTERWRVDYPHLTNSNRTVLELLRQARAASVRELSPDEMRRLPPIPNVWTYFRAEALSEFITKGTTPAADKQHRGHGDVPYIKVYNLTKSGALDFSVDPTFVSSDTHLGFLKRSRVRPNDVLMNLVGPPLGKVSIVPTTYPEWNINQAIARFRPLAGVRSKYLCHYLLFDGTLRRTEAKAKATAGQFNLTLEIARDIEVPICSEEEQDEIVRILEERLSKVAKMESEISCALSAAKILRRSILREAFSGKLVSQALNDEPATVVLERIRAAHGSANGNGSRTRTTKKALPSGKEKVKES